MQSTDKRERLRDLIPLESKGKCAKTERTKECVAAEEAINFKYFVVELESGKYIPQTFCFA